MKANNSILAIILAGFLVTNCATPQTSKIILSADKLDAKGLAYSDCISLNITSSSVLKHIIANPERFEGGSAKIEAMLEDIRPRRDVLGEKLVRHLTATNQYNLTFESHMAHIDRTSSIYTDDVLSDKTVNIEDMVASAETCYETLAKP